MVALRIRVHAEVLFASSRSRIFEPNFRLYLVVFCTDKVALRWLNCLVTSILKCDTLNWSMIAPGNRKIVKDVDNQLHWYYHTTSLYMMTLISSAMAEHSTKWKHPKHVNEKFQSNRCQLASCRRSWAIVHNMVSSIFIVWFGSYQLSCKYQLRNALIN